MPRQPIILCARPPEFAVALDQYVADLREQAPNIGRHGLSKDDFWESGLFHSAIERIRGTQAATTKDKYAFIKSVLTFMQQQRIIVGWKYGGGKGRQDFQVQVRPDHICVIEAKGCLDGNNTQIFERPYSANEFLIWSLCQNRAADPDKNAWSGLHTRLAPQLLKLKEAQKVDGVIIWDMLCGTPARVCPKLEEDSRRSTQIEGYNVPPPCIYLLPKTVPSPKGNPKPPCHTIEELPFLRALHEAFKGDANEVTQVLIEVRRKNEDLQRRTSYYRAGALLAESQWTTLKRED